jgi:hypothetical protein
MFNLSVSGINKFYAKFRLWIGKKRIVKIIMSAMTEKFLIFLLWGMKLYLIVDPDYRRNINDFHGMLRFRDRDGRVNVLVKFAHGKMKTSTDPAPVADVTVSFKDAPSLRKFIIAEKKDVLNSLLKNEININGNFNYLYKFGFMANHLLLKLQS